MSRDDIRSLPTNPNTPVNNNDAVLVNHLFGNQEAVGKTMVSYFKGPFLVAAVVGLVMLPPVDNLIVKMIPGAKDSVYLMIVVKMILAAFLFWLISNWSLAKN